MNFQTDSGFVEHIRTLTSNTANIPGDERSASAEPAQGKRKAEIQSPSLGPPSETPDARPKIVHGRRQTWANLYRTVDRATVQMAADVVLGPAPLHRLSVSSSSQPSTTSSESPQHTPGTPGAFNFSFRYPSSERSHEVIPKIEELDENDQHPGDVSPIVPPDSLPSPAQAVVKRPRGRPRKHPIPSPTAVSKPSKGRSKTGCITCRKRKKKCDERRPTCLHCEKNNVHCEGYPPKEYWRPGKNKGEGRRHNFVVTRELPPLINGVETDTDRHFLDHFNFNSSRVLSLFDDEHNPFKEILLPMAIRHRGLMHSLLCLAGSHLTAQQDPPNEVFLTRRFHHFQKAIDNLRTDQQIAASVAGDAKQPIDDPTVAQTIVLCLNSIVNGEVHGEYRPHLDAAKHLIQSQRSPNQDFQNFLFEFFIYHDVSNSITSIDRRSVMMMEDFRLPDFMIQPEAGALLGVVDGLFGYISKIRQIRDRIRERRAKKLKPLVDYSILSDAGAIDSGLRNWVCAQPENTARYVAACLYQQATYIYLYRTVMPSAPSENLRIAVDKGLEYLRQLPEDSSPQSILLMPVFLLGCAAFHKHQRPDIQKAFDDLQAYSNLGNIKYARIIVENIWEMMDNDNEESWDWETIMLKKGWDFLVT